MSLKAYNLLQKVEVIVGYKTYIELIQDLISPRQTTFTTGMTKEIERVEKALEFVQQKKQVAVISSGDPGVYGMAGLVLEMIDKKQLKIDLEVVPGITAANAAAASLGAPLMHDYAVISLSDLLTPWTVIEKRLKQAAEADFVVALYNPRSKKRQKQLSQARQIMLEYKSSDTPVGIVRRAKWGAEEIIRTTLGKMPENKVDMLTTVIIGNQETRLTEDFIITPRGYRL
ncbi:MAG: precorrin-3B C(17)-methyltransferase [Bacillota bacterium]